MENPVETAIRSKFPIVIPETCIMVIPEREYPTTVYSLLRHFTARLGTNGIYVSLKLPYRELAKGTANNGIPPGSLYYIDAASYTTGKVMTSADCMFVGNRVNLVELSLALTDATTKGKFDFVIFDSLSTMLLYADAKTARRFQQYLVNKIRNLGMLAVILVVSDRAAAGMTDELQEVVDRTNADKVFRA